LFQGFVSHPVHVLLVAQRAKAIEPADTRFANCVPVRQLRIGFDHIFKTDGAIQDSQIPGIDSNFIDVHFN
jgi:hypothetical protein